MLKPSNSAKDIALVLLQAEHSRSEAEAAKAQALAQVVYSRTPSLVP